MFSTIACVAVQYKPFQAIVMYDSCHELFTDPTLFTLQPHHTLFAVDETAFKFLKSQNLLSEKIYKQGFLKNKCWGCQKSDCLLTIAFLTWRFCLKRKTRVELNHNHKALGLKSPRTQEIFISIAFDEKGNPLRGCCYADNGYMDGTPNEWLPHLQECYTVLTAVGSDTGRWLKERVGFPIKIMYESDLKYPCKECNTTNCPLLKAFYAWKSQAIQIPTISH